MATASRSRIRRHHRGLKTNFVCGWDSHKHIHVAYLYILLNYCLTENLRPSHTTVKSVNLSTLFLDMLSPSERVHIVLPVYDNFPALISGKERKPVEITSRSISSKLTWHGWGYMWKDWRDQSLKQSELEHESFNRRVL